MEIKKCPSCWRDNPNYASMCCYCREKLYAGKKTLTTFFELTEAELRALAPAPPQPKPASPVKVIEREKIEPNPEPKPTEEFYIENEILKAYYGKDSKVVIPEGVTSIGEHVFIGRKFLKSVTIPKTVTNIGQDAFWDCDNLTINCPADSYAESYSSDNNLKNTTIR